jgi:undecaprenyl-diphosphatase
VVAKIVPVSSEPVQWHDAIDKVPQLARPTGQGVVAVINPRSGSGRGAKLIELIRGELPDAEVVEIDPSDGLIDELRKVVPRAEVLCVGGGDGTVNAGAAVALESGLPLLALPGGTFNHFARDLGIETTEQALEGLRSGCTVRIDVATANDKIFVNSSSIGSYPSFVVRREALEGRYGKPAAAAIAAIRTMHSEVPMEITVDGKDRSAALLFIGNGAYEPTGFAPRWRPRLDDGVLDVRLLDVGGAFAYLRIVFGLLTGTLGTSPVYVEARVPRSHVVIRDGATKLACDGEVSEGNPDIRYDKEVRALTVFRPSDVREGPVLPVRGLFGRRADPDRHFARAARRRVI